MTSPSPPPPPRAAVEGWFTLGPEPRLLGTRCVACATPYFPPERLACRNPGCGATELVPHPLSTRGTLWSFTSAGYAPPPPFVAADPYVPFAIAAVELAEERLVVLGQVEGAGVDELRVGMPMELTVGTLFTDAEGEVVVWKWRPVRADAGAAGEPGGAP